MSSSGTTTTAATATAKQAVIPHITIPTLTAPGDGCQPFLPSPVELALPGTPLLSSSSGQGTVHPLQAVQQKQHQWQLTSLVLIRSYHTLIPLFRCPPIPRHTRRAHSTRNPSVSRWSTMSYDRPSSWNSFRRISLQPVFFQGQSRRQPGLAPIIEYPSPCFERGGLAHYPKHLGGGAYTAYDAA